MLVHGVRDFVGVAFMVMSFLMVSRAPITTGTVGVLSSQILFTSIFKFLYFLSFSAYLILLLSLLSLSQLPYLIVLQYTNDAQFLQYHVARFPYLTLTGQLYKQIILRRNWYRRDDEDTRMRAKCMRIKRAYHLTSNECSCSHGNNNKRFFLH